MPSLQVTFLTAAGGDETLAATLLANDFMRPADEPHFGFAWSREKAIEAGLEAFDKADRERVEELLAALRPAVMPSLQEVDAALKIGPISDGDDPAEIVLTFLHGLDWAPAKPLHDALIAHLAADGIRIEFKS